MLKDFGYNRGALETFATARSIIGQFPEDTQWLFTVSSEDNGGKDETCASLDIIVLEGHDDDIPEHLKGPRNKEGSIYHRFGALEVFISSEEDQNEE